MSLTLFKQHFKLIAMLLMAVMALSNISSRQLSAYTQPVNQIIMQKTASTCPQAKAQFTRLCHSLSGVQVILTNIIYFLSTFSGKLYFAFIAAVLTSGRLGRLYKPPKQFC